jgi:hypothetical protein
LFGQCTYIAKAAAKKKNWSTKIKGGLLSRAERVFLIFAALALAVYTRIIILRFIISIIAILGNFTAIQRFYSAINLNINYSNLLMPR